MGLLLSDRAGDTSTVTIQHRQAVEITTFQQPSQRCPEGNLGLIGRCQTANPHLEPILGHREHPAVPMGHPLTAQHETDPLTPACRAVTISLKQPLHTVSFEQGVVCGLNRDAGLLQQMSTWPCGIHHEVDRSMLLLIS